MIACYVLFCDVCSNDDVARPPVLASLRQKRAPSQNQHCGLKITLVHRPTADQLAKRDDLRNQPHSFHFSPSNEMRRPNEMRNGRGCNLAPCLLLTLFTDSIIMS